MSPPCRVRFTGGFVLLAAWFVLANGWEPLLTVLGAAAVHELGHWLVLRMLGAEVTGFRLSALGAVLETDSRRLSYGGELAAVLAGPAANLLAAAVLAALGGGRWAAAVGADVVLCVFNLLPVRPLDGGRAAYLLASWLGGPDAGERAARWLGTVTALALAAGIAWAMWESGGSLWLLPALSASVYWGALPWTSGPR
nr:site-2 protease family protein [uncultured Oscillibacter sp.]